MQAVHGWLSTYERLVNSQNFFSPYLTQEDLTGLVRDLYGIPTQAQAEAQRIAAERLELDRKKAEEGSTDTHAELEIVGLPEEYRR